MWQLIEAGGPVLATIGFLSIIALGFVVERLLTFRRARTDHEEFFGKLEELLRLGRLDEAETYCEASAGIVPRVLLSGLRARTDSIEDTKRVLGDEIQMRAIPALDRHLGKVAVIGRAAPMLGLLGTVVGMITMFGDLQDKGAADMDALAGGIKLALGTTAAGLMVAIPIMFLHAWLRGQVRELELDLYASSTRFLGLMSLRAEAGASVSDGKKKTTAGAAES